MGICFSVRSCFEPNVLLKAQLTGASQLSQHRIIEWWLWWSFLGVRWDGRVLQHDCCISC